MQSISKWLLAIVFLFGLILLNSGCLKSGTVKSTMVAPKNQAKDDHDHDHPAEGPHGGALVEWGDHEYHAEFTVDHKTKSVTVYVLDKSAEKAPKVDAAKITKVMLTITNATPPLTLELKLDSAKSDSKGIGFVGTHDQFGKEMEFQGNVSGTIEGEHYSGELKESDHDHQHEKKKSGLLENHLGGIHVAFAQATKQPETYVKR